ncbi:glycosyltransferase family 39 protein [Nakamurella deserti]|uniref:glycosyltransferase family 39 protein n=1 Tax=Nakamurella deserti TaxID=2164074 RepID=UPI000DBE4889|nr:glycosyltransferase family 39 protein [Nakamurella deserti]
MDDATPVRPPPARLPVFVAAGLVAVALTLASNGYGYHRDELYFRMLPPAWGYVDQPPLLPLVVRTLSGIVDEPWMIRIPATLAATLTVIAAAATARELGGGRTAQSLAAFGTASTSIVLVFGHTMLTASLDLLIWPVVCLCVLWAVVRDRPGWWLVAGLVTGLSMYNKLLIAMLLAGIAVGLLVGGPRRVLATRWPVLGILLALAVGAPNLIYQATHDWPQLQMGAALAAGNSGRVRSNIPVFLPLLLGPPLLPVLVAGMIAPYRSAALRAARWLPVALVVVLVATWVGGTQFYYPAPLMLVVFAVGCVPVSRWLAGRQGWRVGAVVAVAVNGAVAAVIALPVIPERFVGDTPLPGMNAVTGDSIGWPTYVDQIAAVWAALPVDERAAAVIVTANYGEAGAIARFGPHHGLPAAYSGHNALADGPPPPDTATTAVVVGRAEPTRLLFRTCTAADELDNGRGVDNEEQEQPVVVCRGPIGGWAAVWPAMRHRS